MPDLAREDYSHLLDTQQKATAEAAAAQGRPFDVRGQALANLVGKFEDPHQALTYLSETSNPLQTRKTELETLVAGGTHLSAAETAELATINGQLAGTASISADVVREISQAKAQRFEEYRNQGVQSLDGLRGTVEGLRISAETAKNQLAAARRMYPTTDPTRAEKLKPFEDAFRMAEVKHKEAEGIYNDMHKQAVARQARENAKAEKDKAEARREQYKDMSLDEITDAAADLKSRRDRVEQELRRARVAGKGTDEINGLKKQLADIDGEYNEVNTILGRKQVQDAGDIDSDLTQQAEALTRARSDRAAVEGNISTRETKIDGIRTQIQTLRDDLEGTGLSAKERSTKQGELYNLTRQLKAEEETLGLDSQRLQEIETGEQAESKAFKDKDSQGRADELFNLSQDMDISKYPINSINNRLLYGGNITREELAAWSREISDTLIDRGRGGVDMQELHRIFAQRPELRIAVAKRITEDEETQKFLREKFPNSWERIIDFAKKNPAWLMILLAIIVGTAGAAGAVVGPVAGGALGAAGVGGGAFGVSKRNW